MKINEVSFSFYGIGVKVESSDDAIIRAAEHDFSYFASSSPGRYELRVTYHCQKPDYESLPVMASSLITLQNIVFKEKSKTYLDYFARALSVCDKEKGTCDIYTEDKDLAHEIVYLTILSRVSELLDKRRLHRIHGLGFEYKGRGILLLLPCKGGKSTLAMKILQDPKNDIRLISEESPLIKSDGALLPFPLRIGIEPQNVPSGIEEKFTRNIKRMEYAPKLTIDVKYFGNKICNSELKPAIILLGRRSTGDASQISPIFKLAALRECRKNSVIGQGLYQGEEFVGQNCLFHSLERNTIRFSRMYNNVMLVSRSKTFSFIMGRNIQKNYATLIRFLSSQS